MNLFPSEQDVREGAQRLGQKCVVLAVIMLACGGVIFVAPRPFNYIALVIGLLLAVYAVMLVAVVNGHQRRINAETMQVVSRFRDDEER